MTRTLLLVYLSLFTVITYAQEQQTEAIVNKEFVIVFSSPKYEEALRVAKSASTKLAFKLDLRGLKKSAATGLTFSKKICEESWDEYPCYVARGRYDDGNYVSIEYSNEYVGFSKGYYIVIVAAGEKGSPDTKAALAKAKKIYPDAYAKATKVYIGCMH